MNNGDKPYCEQTSRRYDVTGPDRDDEVCVEFDCETNVVWFTKRDVEILMARFANNTVGQTTTEKIKARIGVVQDELEQASMGGVGKDGATREELFRAAQAGQCFANNADYHTMQSAWLMLEELKNDLP